MLIVIEGMDNTGKTTLAQRLSKDLGIRYRHNDRYECVDDALEYLLKHTLPLSAPVIIDRLTPISEAIYGKVLRGQSMFMGLHMASLSALLNTGNCVVMCKPPLDAVQEFGDREQMEGVIDHSKSLYRCYDLMKTFLNMLSDTGVKEYNYLVPQQYDEVFSFVSDKVEKWNARSHVVASLEGSLETLINFRKNNPDLSIFEEQ